MAEFVWKSRILRPADEIFAWHESSGAFQRLTPPWVGARVESAEGGIRDGGEVRLKQELAFYKAAWHLRHEGYVPGRQFCDRQIDGPFASWFHRHQFEPAGESACDVIDRIDYQLPAGKIGNTLGAPHVRRELERVFRYRHDILKMDLETHPLPGDSRRRVIAVTGATGLIGSVLTSLLTTAGHEIRKVSRGSSADIRWDPEKGRLDVAGLEGVDAVVHLAGEPIAQRWTDAARARIMESRRSGTRLLAEAVAALDRRPAVFVSMSGANAYGVSRPGRVAEESGFGEGFLAQVCREWEKASECVEKVGIRRAVIRSGVVLSPAGGAMAKLLPVFRMGGGGPIGDGSRWMSWIAIDDLAAILAHAVLDDRYKGVINGSSPEPVSNKNFAKTMASVLHRPAIVPVPPAALKIAFGQMAEETIMSDLQLEPRRLQELGYDFRFPVLRDALSHLLGGE